MVFGIFLSILLYFSLELDCCFLFFFCCMFLSSLFCVRLLLPMQVIGKTRRWSDLWCVDGGHRTRDTHSLARSLSLAKWFCVLSRLSFLLFSRDVSHFLIRYFFQYVCCMPRLRNDLYCVEWDIKLYYTIPVCCMKAITMVFCVESLVVSLCYAGTGYGYTMHRVSARLLRQFTVLNIPTPTDQSLITIYSHAVQSTLDEFSLSQFHQCSRFVEVVCIICADIRIRFCFCFVFCTLLSPSLLSNWLDDR